MAVKLFWSGDVGDVISCVVFGMRNVFFFIFFLFLFLLGHKREEILSSLGGCFFHTQFLEW